MCYTGVENRTSAPNQYNSIPRIPFRTCVSLKKTHTKSFTSAFNKHYPNIGVLPWQCEYATGLEKVYRQQNASVCWTPCRISVACYRANKNKWHISYSRHIFTFLSYSYSTMCMKYLWKSIQSFSFLSMNYKNNCLCIHIFKMSSGLHNSLIGSMSLVSVTIGLWKMKDKNISLLETKIRHI